MKYVILAPKPDVIGLDLPLIFFAPTLYREVAEKWSATHHPVAAGFCEFLGGRVHTFGRSISLGLGPRPVDAALISSFDRATNAMAR